MVLRIYKDAILPPHSQGGKRLIICRLQEHNGFYSSTNSGAKVLLFSELCKRFGKKVTDATYSVVLASTPEPNSW